MVQGAEEAGEGLLGGGDGKGWEEGGKKEGAMANLKLYQKSVTSKSHNSLNSIFKMNLKSP